MIVAPGGGATERFQARSDEVLATPLKEVKPVGFLTSDLVSGLLTAFSVFAAAMAFILKRASGLYSGGKQDALFYIPARLGLPEIWEDMRLLETNLTYLRMADILLAHGLSSQDRVGLIKALKCLLFVKGIAKVSFEIVKRNLTILQGTPLADADIARLANLAVSVGDQAAYRALVDDVALGKLS